MSMRGQKPRLYLAILARAHNPDRSWWAETPREAWTRTVEQEAERMRLSRYGNCHPSPGKPGMGTIEIYRARKAMGTRVGH